MKIKLLNNCWKVQAVIFITIALIISMVSPVSAATATNITVIVPQGEIYFGSQFTVNLEVTPNSSIAGIQAYISFDPSLITVNSVAEGNLFKQNGADSYFIPGQIDNNAGNVSGIAGVIITPGETVSNSGSLAIITFTAGFKNGTCPITLSNVIVGDINGQSVPKSTSSGVVSITSNLQNQPPILTPIGNKSIQQDVNLSFSISASDPEADVLTYSANNLPLGATFNAFSRLFSWTPTSSQSGSFADIHFEVTDGISLDFENITITVTLPSTGGGGGGGGFNVISLPPGTTDLSGIVGTSGVFNKAVLAVSDDRLVNLSVNQNTTGLTSSNQPLTQISIVPIQSIPALPDQTTIIGSVYSFEPDGATFDVPVTITMLYSGLTIPVGVDQRALTIATWNTTRGVWENLKSTVNTNEKTISAQMKHFSIYSILASVRPAQFVISDLSIIPDSIHAGEKAIVNAKIGNTGDLTNTCLVTFNIDDVAIQTKEVKLAGNENQNLIFDVSFKASGNHTISVNGISKVIVVQEEEKATFEIKTLKLSSSEVNIGEVVTIIVPVANTGNLEGVTELTLKINGVEETSKEVRIEADVLREYSFNFVRDIAGTYPININGQVATIVVKQLQPAVNSSAPPAEDEFSLSLLGQIIGGAAGIILLVNAIILLRRRQLLRKSI